MRGTNITALTEKYRKAVASPFPDLLTRAFAKRANLRYGENPNQSAGIYDMTNSNIPRAVDIRLVKNAKEGWSATNFMDVVRGMYVVGFFPMPAATVLQEDEQHPGAAAVMKHCIPSGLARQHNGNSLDDIYCKARDVDKRSAYGGVVVLNRPLDVVTAEAIHSSFVEVVAAPGYEEGTVGKFDDKKELRLVEFSHLERIPRFVGDDTDGLLDFKMLPTGNVIIQEPYLCRIRGPQDLICDPMVKKEDRDYVVARDPTPQELDDMLTAWYVNLGTRSNGIVIVKDGVTLAVGSGQQERVGAVEQAIVKAYQKAMDREGIKYNPLFGMMGSHHLSHNPLEGAVMSSDAYYPFKDSIERAASVGISATIQPGGSKQDYAVIEAVNRHHMAMAFTLERCFGHF